MFGPPVSHREGTWWWCSPLAFISALSVRSVQMLTLAVGTGEDFLDERWVLKVRVPPGTAHVFWRGLEEEQRQHGPDPTFVPDPEEGESAEEDEADVGDSLGKASFIVASPGGGYKVEQPGEEEGGKKGGRKTHEEEEKEAVGRFA